MDTYTFKYTCIYPCMHACLLADVKEAGNPDYKNIVQLEVYMQNVLDLIKNTQGSSGEQQKLRRN